MDARCERCKGGCCETMTLEVVGTNNDFQRFLELRSTPQQLPGGKVARNFKCPCSMLVNGRCAIYDMRPVMCQVFEPGGAQCRATVQSLRTPEEAKAILGETPTA